MSQRQGLKAQIAQLRAENAAMRELLEAGNAPKDPARAPIDIEATRGTRDRLAVSALIMHHMDPHDALEQLGYPVRKMNLEERRRVAREIFENDRVRHLLRDALKPAEDAKDTIVARLVEVALYGEPPQRVQAFAHLAKACGWFPAPNMRSTSGASANIGMLDDAPSLARADVRAVLAHEPEPAMIAQHEDVPDLPMPTAEGEFPSFPPYPASARSARCGS